LLVLGLYLFLWPVSIHPIAWEPHPADGSDPQVFGVHFSKTTSAEQVGDWLYVGSLQEPQWGRIRISSLP
jgi:hypothetical protein